MKKPLVYLVVAAIVIVGIVVAFSAFSKKSINSNSGGLSECSQFSNKDGYRGCMSLVNGKEKKCRFKIDNKVNEATQQMEFTYICFQK